METVIYQNGIRYVEKQYNTESDFERLVKILRHFLVKTQYLLM